MTPDQVEEAKRYHHIVIHDNTYRCNRFGMPLGLFNSINNHGHTIVTAQCLVSGECTEDYEWAFRHYIRAAERAPRVFMTDRDPAVEAAVKTTFPIITLHVW